MTGNLHAQIAETLQTMLSDVETPTKEATPEMFLPMQLQYP